MFRVDREVTVLAADAIRTSGGKIAGHLPGWVKSCGLRIEPTMTGRQVAWVRRSDGGWLAVVLMPAASGNQQSRVTVPLWLDPTLISADLTDERPRWK